LLLRVDFGVDLLVHILLLVYGVLQIHHIMSFVGLRTQQAVNAERELFIPAESFNDFLVLLAHWLLSYAWLDDVVAAAIFVGIPPQ